MLNGLDLFSGIGGLTCALSPWVWPIAYCENDRYAQSVLLNNMRLGNIPTAPVCDDIRLLRGDDLPVVPDIIYGGFPCQDISVAGHGVGLDGERSGLYWEMFRLIKALKPAFVFLENVPAIRTRGARAVAESLTSLGYDCKWDIVSAQEVGGLFIGKRWFLVAAADSQTLREQSRWREGKSWTCKTLGSPNGDKRNSPWASERPTKPSVSRAGDGIPCAVDRDRCLGNAVVPQQAREAFMRLMGLTKEEPQKEGE